VNIACISLDSVELNGKLASPALISFSSQPSSVMVAGTEIVGFSVSITEILKGVLKVQSFASII